MSVALLVNRSISPWKTCVRARFNQFLVNAAPVLPRAFLQLLSCELGFDTRVHLSTDNHKNFGYLPSIADSRRHRLLCRCLISCVIAVFGL